MNFTEKNSDFYLIDSTSFALQNDHLQQFGCVAFGVLTRVTRQDLCEEPNDEDCMCQWDSLTIPSTLKTCDNVVGMYLLTHAVHNFQIFGVTQEGVCINGDVVVKQRHHV